MADLVHNETMKLLANGCNTGSVTSIAGGTVAPVVSYIYGIGPQVADPANIWILAPVCLIGGCFLHILGQVFLRGLDDAD